MEVMRFDRLARALATASRRQIVQCLSGAVLGGALSALEPDAADVLAACTGCRRCGERCCKAGSACRARTCVRPCATSRCGRFPGGCTLFPADNVWRARVDGLPVHPRSDAYVASIGRDTGLHPDFGSGLYQGKPIGIPFASVPGSQRRVKIRFTEYGGESDPGPYPIPLDAPIEGGPCGDGDRHVLVVDRERCILYELYHARPRGDGGWDAGSGAIFDLSSNALRRNGWTSADAAGFPILPGLVSYEEVAAGKIAHALRFTADVTQDAFVWPARHEAGSTSDTNVPPMGQRFRLKAGFDTRGFSRENRVILTALKTHGMFLADNGGDWFLSGAPDPRWNNDDLHELQERVHGRDFEAVDGTFLKVSDGSGQVKA
jgi:hypothetical protein